MNRGDIFYADLNPVIGSEISKTRPVLIISNDVNNEYSSTVTVIPISSYTGRKIYPFEVLIESKSGILQNDSLLRTNQIRTIDKSRLKNKVSSVDHNVIQLVEKALCLHLGIDF
ncbi:MAG: type II toxin-antitoxin system PemK/MazF family toxin [Ignavibacteria bacterium]|nr:type II toxin-antitoxin system PemK/MazF family toxin [Ignavibacteria bacterium]